MYQTYLKVYENVLNKIIFIFKVKRAIEKLLKHQFSLGIPDFCLNRTNGNYDKKKGRKSPRYFQCEDMVCSEITCDGIDFLYNKSLNKCTHNDVNT